MKTAIITGASSGIGVEFLKELQKEKDLEEIWIIARRADKLEQLAKESNKLVRVVSLDLSKEESLEYFRYLLDKEKPDIRFLINNAGFGKLGNIYEIDYKIQTQMISLNNGALTAMCALCIDYMTCGACIINVASIAAFAPNPRMAVYCATKSYVLHFTKCIREELKSRKIDVLAVCPGPMATEFLDVAGISGGKSKTFETLPYCNPKLVAYKSIKKVKQGRAIYTPRAFYKLYHVLAKLLPHNIIMKFSKT